MSAKIGNCAFKKGIKETNKKDILAWKTFQDSSIRLLQPSLKQNAY